MSRMRVMSLGGMLIGQVYQPDIPGAPAGAVSEPEIISLVATASISALKPVTVTGVTADSATPSHLGKVVGISTAAIASGFSGEVQVFGMMTDSSWSWTPGSSIFLNGTSLSQTPPSTGFSQIIGVAKTSDTIMVSLSDPILL